MPPQAPGDPCGDGTRQLVDLRDWAWSQGRTDVVLDLDLHEQTWVFQVSPTRPNLVRLAEVMPQGRLGGTLEVAVRHLVAAGAAEQELRRLRAGLLPWSMTLCTTVRAHVETL